MKVQVTWQQGVYFKGEARTHILPIEGPEEHGGKNRGMRPMETVLVALGSCSSYDIVSILHKMRQPITGCELEIKAERADAIPAVFREIRMHFLFCGKDLDPHKLEKAVSLSVDKYCSVAKMLVDGGVKIYHSFETIPPEKEDKNNTN